MLGSLSNGDLSRPPLIGNGLESLGPERLVDVVDGGTATCVPCVLLWEDATAAQTVQPSATVTGAVIFHLLASVPNRIRNHRWK